MAQLQALAEGAARSMDQDKAQILAAHQLLLQDPEFAGAMDRRMRDARVSAEGAVEHVTAEAAGLLAAMDDPYRRERAADIRDVGERLLDNLLGRTRLDWSRVEGPVVLIAQDLTPSDTAQLDPSKVTGLATATGGRTSHAAIMARALEIPAVVGIPGF